MDMSATKQPVSFKEVFWREVAAHYRQRQAPGYFCARLKLGPSPAPCELRPFPASSERSGLGERAAGGIV